MPLKNFKTIFFDDINIIVSSVNFFDPMHQKIFSAIENLIYKGMLANPITLKSYFEDDKDELNIPEYLVKITKFSTSTKNNSCVILTISLA